VERHAGGRFLDYAAINVRPIPLAVKKRYARQSALPVENDIDAILKMGLRVMACKLAQHAGKIRHDPAATAAMVIKLAEEGSGGCYRLSAFSAGLSGRGREAESWSRPAAAC